MSSPVSPFFQPSTQLTRYVAAGYKAAFLMELVIAYMNLTNDLHRAGAVIGALMFVIIETFWVTITSEDKAGNVTITGWTGKLGHSSFAQFWSNVIFTPLILFLYRDIVTNPILRVLLFPFNIWLLEIIEGYVIMFLFGKNVAWEYRGNDAYFHGNIKLGYTGPWIALGLVVELAWNPLILPLAVELETSGAVLPVLILAGVVTLIYSPRMGFRGLWCSLYGLKQD
jgi:hypothetical protein